MMSKKRMGILAVLVMALALFVGFNAGAANADTGGTTTVSPVTYSQASFNVTDTDSSVALLVLNEKDKVQLRWQSPTSAMLKGPCPTINKWSQRRGLKCFTAGPGLKGKKFCNSGVNPLTGRRVYFTDHIGSKYTPVGSVFYWDPVARTWRKKKCKNYVRFYRLVQLSWEQVHLTRYATWSASATATATAQVLGTATASCSTDDGQVWASATVQAWGTASASATVHVQGHDRTKVLAKARGQAIGVVTSQQISLSGSAQAKAEAGVSGNATVFCSGTPPPPPHFTQVSCQLPEHILVNDSDYMYCVATNDNGALISLTVKDDTDRLVTVSNQVSVDVRNQVGDPCPSGAQCFRLTLLAGSTTGSAHITAQASSNGTLGGWDGFVPIVPDQGF